MLWIPGPHEVLIVVAAWAGLIVVPGLFAWIAVVVRRRRARRRERERTAESRR
jgi:hypothetical protein